MKKTALYLSIALSLALLLAACGSAATATPTATATPSANTVIAAGHLVPAHSLYMPFLASGRVEHVLVQQGDYVSQGQVLATLGDRQQAAAALAGVQAQLLAAQQAYDQLVRTADAVHAQAWQAWLNAQKNTAAAQLAWDQLDQHSLQTDIDNAQADVTTRQTDLTNAQADFARYSSLPASDANRIYYESALRTAQINYDTAVQKVLSLNTRRDSLQAGLNLAQAAEAEALRTYQNTQSGPNTDTLALAQSQLDAATVQAALAQSALDNYDLKAPFAGKVAAVNITANQMVSPQTWAVALENISQWYVDTSDLTEMDVVKLSVGQAVQLTADALPGVSMDGAVESISQAPLLQGGDILYTVHILLKNPDPRLMWGMTMEATFTP